MSGSNVGSVVAKSKTTIITGVTEAIDRQGYNMQIMGERFAKVRLNLKSKRKEIIHRAMVDSGAEDTRKTDMQQYFESLFKSYSNPNVWNRQFEIKQQLLTSPFAIKIENLADLITIVRVYCWKDPRYADSYVDEPLEEHGTRFVKQLTKMAILLPILFDKAFFDGELWEILLKFGEDSCLPIRLKILKLFKDEGFHALTTEYISEKLDMGRQSIKCRLSELEAAHVLKAHYDKNAGYEKIIGWSLKDDIIELIKSIWDIQPTLPETKELILSEELAKELEEMHQTQLDSSKQ